MLDYQAQYKTELHNQEAKSNRRTLRIFLWIFVALAAIWLLTVLRVFVVDAQFVTVAFGISTVLCLPVLYIFLKVDLSSPWIRYYFLTLICLVSGIVAALLSFHAVLLYVLPLLLAIQYRDGKALWFAFGVNTVTMTASMLAGFYFGLCDLNLLYASNHSLSWYMQRNAWVGAMLPMNENPSFIIVAYGAFPRTIILFIFALMLRNTILTSHEDERRIAELTYHKETDLRTKLFNKNKYEEMAAAYYPGIERIAVIFWDINNLKKVNDKYGHSMGDLLIETVSEKLHEQVNERRRVYRVGGDEFLLVIDEPASGEAAELIEKVREELRRSSEEGGICISSAAGYAEGAGVDIKEVVKCADAKMYEDKNAGREGRA